MSLSHQDEEAALRLELEFSDAWSPERSPEIIDKYLPPPHNRGIWLHVLVRLIKADMIFRNREELAVSTAHYLDKFPSLLDDDARLHVVEIFVEQYRLLGKNCSDVFEVGEYLVQCKVPEKYWRELLSQLKPISRYKKCREIKGGGGGIVFEAIDRELSRRVAVKELRSFDMDSPLLLARFRQEATITAELDHPGVIPIYGFERDELGMPRYAMRLMSSQADKTVEQNRSETRSSSEFASPTELQERIKRFHSSDGVINWRSQQFRDLLIHFQALCNTIAYAHSRRVIHRDLKPANVLTGHYGETLVADWGLANHLDDESGGESALGGTIGYMSPEQESGERCLGPESDVYSLGAILYTIVTANEPQKSNSRKAPSVPRSLKTLYRRVDARVPLPRELKRGCPQPLEAVCLKAMASSPNARYSSAKELAADVERWIADEPIRCEGDYHEPFSVPVKRWIKKHSRAIGGVTVFALITAVVVYIGGLYVQQVKNRSKAVELVDSARKEYAVRHFGEAVRLAHEAQALDADNASACEVGARSELAIGSPGRALPLADRFLQQNNSKEARILKAEVLINLNRNGEAVSLIDSDYNEAISELESLVQEMERAAEHVMVEQDFVDRMHDASSFQSVLLLRNRALRGVEGNTQIDVDEQRVTSLQKRLVQSAMTHIRTQPPQFRRASLGTLRRQFPTEFAVYEELVQVLVDQGEFDDAKQLLQEAILQIPGDPRPYRQLATVLESSGDFRAAAEAWATAYRKNGNITDLNESARISIDVGDYDRGLADARTVFQIEPSKEHQLRLARALYHPDPESARLRLPWFTIQSLSPLLVVSNTRWSGDPEVAYRLLAELRAKFPDDADIHLALGHLLSGQGSWRSAEKEYIASNNLHPTVEAELGVAHCTLMRGDREAANLTLADIHDRDEARLDAAVGLFVSQQGPTPGNWSRLIFRYNGIFTSSDLPELQYLRTSLAAGYRPSSSAAQQLRLELPAPSSETQRLVKKLQAVGTLSDAEFKALEGRGLETLGAIRLVSASLPDAQRELATRIRKLHLTDETDALAALVVRRQVTPGSEDNDLYQSIFATPTDRLAEALVGLVEDADRPLWIRGMSLMASAEIADRFPDVRQAVFDAHDSHDPTLYRHALLAMAKMEGDDVMNALMEGITRTDQKYHDFLRLVISDKAAQVPLKELVSQFALRYFHDERRFSELTDGRLPQLLVDYPSSQELLLFDTVLYKQGGVTALYQWARDDSLSEHTKWLLCQILQHWPAEELIPAARRLAEDQSPLVRLEAAGLLIACGDDTTALRVLTPLCRSTGEWPTRVKSVTYASRPWTPSLWLTTVRVSQPGPLEHRALLLLGRIRNRSSMEVLLDALSGDLPYIRTNALASLCQLATDSTLNEELNKQFDQIAPLYRDADSGDRSNLCLLAGLLARKDAEVIEFLEESAQASMERDSDFIEGTNALWALSISGNNEAGTLFLERASQWIDQRPTGPLQSVWRAAFFVEHGLDMKAAEGLLEQVQQELKDEDDWFPQIGLDLTRFELCLAQRQLDQAGTALDQLLNRNVLSQRMEFDRIRRWLNTGATSPSHISQRWRLGMTDYEYAVIGLQEVPNSSSTTTRE